MTAENSFVRSMSKPWPWWRDRIVVVLTTAFFFLLPLQTRFIFQEMPLYEWGTLSVYGVEILGWVVIALGLIRCQVSGVRCQVLKLPVVLAVLGFLSIAWASDKAIALQAAVRLLEGVLLYVIMRQVSGVRCQIFVHAFLAGAVLQAGLGIYQFFTQSSFASTLLGMALHDPRALGTSVVEFADQRWLRAYGGLPHPNVLGGYLVVALAVAILMWQRSQMSQGWQKLFVKVVVPVLLTGIFFSFSRGAWVAMLIVMLYWVICSARLQSRVARGLVPRLAAHEVPRYSSDFKRSHYIAFGMTVLYMMLLVITFRPLVVARLAPVSTERLETKSRVERIAGLRESWELIKKHPALGVGIGNYTQAVARELRPGQPLYSYQPVHNMFLLVMAELGLMGFVLLLAVLYTTMRQSKFCILHFSFLILLLTDHYLWTLPLGILLFWAILGLSTNKTQTQT